MDELTEADLLNELLQEYSYSPRLPGDVDAYQIMKLDPLKRSRTYWQNNLKAKAERGELVEVAVYDSGKVRNVYRKVSPS